MEFYFDVLVLLFSLFSAVKSKIPTEPVVELRWDFSDCGQSGRFGPTQEMCDVVYTDTNLEGDIQVDNGVQIWTVPVSGLYLVTARGPSGASTTSRNPGKGADITAEFHMTEGQRMKIIVGQQSDSADLANPRGPIGGSGGTFIQRESDEYILMVAGGGSSGSGTKWNDWSVNADASLTLEGKNSSRPQGLYGLGGVEKVGGTRGALLGQEVSSSGGGAGYTGDGDLSYASPGQDVRIRAAKAFKTTGVTHNAPGVGGQFMYTDKFGNLIENNGGFGGGGSGSRDGGSGGGGGYSGGGGGSLNGWGGGGGSINNGGRQRNAVTNRGKGAVIISFIGHQCCGPVVVYIAMTFIAGVLFTLLIGFIIMRLAKAIRDYDGNGGKMLNKFLKRLKSDKQEERPSESS
ncbi:uncharacterized protein LOC120337640 [Styela clava]